MFVSPPRKFLPGQPEVGKNRAVRDANLGMRTYSNQGLGPCLDSHRPVDVTVWRLCRLLQAGFDRPLAETLASTPNIDLHVLLQLIDRGCPPELAARIASPVDGAEH
jgi:hypothetical protein